MNALSNHNTRRIAASGFRAIRPVAARYTEDDARIEVIPWDTLLAERAVRLFESRPDKDWSLTDCLSFMVMAERQLPKALTSDRHFVQAGFEALLLADPS